MQPMQGKPRPGQARPGQAGPALPCCLNVSEPRLPPGTTLARREGMQSSILTLHPSRITAASARRFPSPLSARGQRACRAPSMSLESGGRQDQRAFLSVTHPPPSGLSRSDSPPALPLSLPLFPRPLALCLPLIHLPPLSHPPQSQAGAGAASAAALPPSPFFFPPGTRISLGSSIL